MAVIIDANFKLPRCCNECQLCSCQKIGLFYCDITTNYIDIDSEERDADCPLKEVPTGKWIRQMKSEIADSLEFWDYSPNNNPLARDMLETINTYCAKMVEEQTGENNGCNKN